MEQKRSDFASQYKQQTDAELALMQSKFSNKAFQIFHQPNIINFH